MKNKSRQTQSAHNRTNVTRSLLILLSLIVLAVTILLLPGVRLRVIAAGQAPKGGEAKISESAAQQIQALLAEKESRTAAQKKLDSQLVYAIKFRRGDSLAAIVPALETGVVIDPQGKTVVDITAKVGGSLIEDLASAGADITSVFPQYNSIRATVPLDQLETIAAFPQIIFIMPKQEGQVWRAAEPHSDNSATASGRDLAPDFAERAARVRARLMDALPKLAQKGASPETGSVNSQGDTTHKANTARSSFGANGAGVRIGVLSNGVGGLAASQASGDLPASLTVLPGQAGTGAEGTAMLEIIYDLAPGAQLFFATANPIIAAFAQNIRDLRTAGCDIIVDDVFYFVETPFQDGQAPSVVSNTNGGLVTQAVKDVTAAGALYFSSAGNQGNKNDATSSCYQGDFVNGGTIGIVPGGNVHDFGGGAQFDVITVGSGSVIDLYWADPLGGSDNDYDLFVLNSTSTAVVASSANVQSATQDPFEQVNSGNTTNNRVVVLQKTGSANRFFHITINANGSGKLGTSTEGTTKGHSIAMDAFSCAATPAVGPFPSPFSSSNVVETFSADGPRRIFFNADSSAITPGNFSSTGGTLRQKPDITAADGVSVTGNGGFPTTFFGTSAAAPHAGAIAGLLRSAFPSLTPAQVRTILTSTAIDIEGAGVDRDAGAGIIMAFEAEQSNGAVASANFEVGTVTATELCCNANTFIEPGESASLMVQLTNTGVANATNITAMLTTTTPNVNILLTGTSAYPDLSFPSGSGTNAIPFSFFLGSSAPCDLKADFVLTITYTGGNSPKVAKFSVQTGRPPVSVTTAVDATSPPASSDYTAVTGTQTNRLFRDGRASTCNLPKTACPGTLVATNPRFDAYTFSTCSGSATSRCITATLTSPANCGGTAATQLFATAYLGSFVTSNICTNYLADGGVSPGASTSISFTFTVPASSSFVVVVAEVTPNGAAACNYTLTVSGVCLACPTAAKVDNVTANGYNDGQVLLQWHSSQEVDNLGYNVYREQNGRRVKLTPQLVAGSALMVGPGTTLTSGNSYAWADAPTGDFGSVKYWLEDVNLTGQSKWNGPISVQSNTKGSPSFEQSALLARLGMHAAQVSLPQMATPAARAARLPQPGAQQQLAPPFALASSPAVKLSIKQEGWYRVSQPALVAAGLDPKVNPRFLQMFVDGRETPITVEGEQNGKFDPTDAVEFYGVGLDSAASDTHVYWLAAGAQPGKRIASVSGRGGLVATGGFPYTVERKDRTVYFSALRNGDAENFFGSVIAGQPVDQALWIQHLNSAPGASAVIEAALQGVTQSSHSVRLQLNGTDVGALNFEGQSAGKVTLSVPSSLLREGENQVRLAAQNGQSDVSLVDSIRITYSHSYHADSNLLRLTAAGGQQISVDGFTSSAIQLADITDPNAVQTLGATIKPTKAGYAITASVPGSGDHLLLALVDSQIKQPAQIAANVPSSWRTAGNGANLLIFTQRDFVMALGPLAAVRQSQGLSVAVVDIEDVYDEFSYGNKTPQALKDFISFAATSWKKKPQFALLAGQASYDPRNYLGFGDSDIVPTKLLDTGYMETASDEWLADLNGDGVAELSVGRLPCRSPNEASKMVRKITDYERSSPSSEVLLVADANDGYDFEAISSELQGLIPGEIRVTQLNRGRMDGATAKSQLIDGIQRGQKIVNYTGHGNVNQWRGNLLTNEDASVLTNADHLSLFVMMTCLNGYFDDPALDSLAVSLMKAERGGAVAVWASSGMTGPGDQAALNQQMFRALFDTSEGSLLTLGEAVMRAKSLTGDRDVRRTWILFGDPAMRLK